MHQGSWLAGAITCLLFLRAVEVAKHMFNEDSDLLHEIAMPEKIDLRQEITEEDSAKALTMRRFLRENDCTDVYLDLGTNVGVQPRKLYQPECYPRALSLPHFERVFGPISESRRRRVCTLGFEPNPGHAAYLGKLQNFLQSLGFPVMFFTNTAVTGRDMTNVTFFFDAAKKDSNEVGASLIQGSTSGRNETVTDTMSLHTIMTELKTYGKINTLLMKFDMEGSEYEALPGKA
jgi:hypothetical protein